MTSAPRVIVLQVALLALAAPSFAQMRVIISGGFRAAYQEVVPEFERTSGITVVTTTGQSVGASPNTIGAQLRRGTRADVVILSREGLAELIAEGRIVSGTDTDLARTPLAMAVRTGAPKPDISTVDAFRATLLRAKSVAFLMSTHGVYLTTELFPRLGIVGELAKKSTTVGVTAVASGDAELAIQPLSELLPVQGVDVVGALPSEIQKINVYAAAVVANSTEIEAARRLIAFLAPRAAAAAVVKSGMEPAVVR